MRNLVLPMTVVAVLLLLQSSPVATPSFAQPFERAPAVLNGCTETALFAILNSDRGQACLTQLLPRASNAPSRYSIFCSGGTWGCCVKTQGMSNCKITGPIPSRRVPRPPAVIDR